LKGISVIIIAADERDAAAVEGRGGVERGLEREWVAAEVRFRRLLDAVLLNAQVDE
jgi:hypothetical protein